MAPLSMDLRKRVIQAVESREESITDIAKRYSVGRKTIYRWRKLLSNTNSLKPKTGFQKGHSHKIADLNLFKNFVDKHKEHTLNQMTIEWEKLTGIKVSINTIYRKLMKLNYSSKKNVFLQRSQSKKKN